MKKNKNKEVIEKDFPLILKSGATDLRRQEKSLVKLAENNLDGIKLNTLYGFSNKNNTSIKMIKINTDSSLTMIKVKRKNPYPWPGYVEKGKEGYTVELNGVKRSEFLKGIGCPENL